jgi:3-oxoacyl-[acyl-carrier-protein] synthase II
MARPVSSTAVGVVVTGLGAIVGSSCGIDQVAEMLAGPGMRPVEVDRRAGYHLPESARTALLTTGLDLSRWVSPAAGRRMSPPSKLAVASARMAVEDAGLSSAAGGSETTVVLSVAFGAIQVTESLLRTALDQGPEMVSPFTFTESVANAAAAQVAIANQAKGPNLTIAQGEAGVLTAVGRGAALVAAGRADRALVGSVQEMPPILHALLDRFGALARPQQGGESARPFDRRRNGFVAAEGAVVLVLENEARARERGARVRARVRGFGGAFDATAPRVGWGSGHLALATALRDGCDRAGVALRDIDRIVSGASGSIAGDRLEALTLRAAWGERELPPILAPKGVTGEYGGGFLAAGVLAVSDQSFAATGGFSEPDPALAVVPHQGQALPPASLTLLTSLASGGAASWLLLERP